MGTGNLLPEGRVRDLVSTADRQFASDSHAAAIDTYRTALAELPGDGNAAVRSEIESRMANAWIARARYHQAAGRLRQAFETVTEALSLDPSNPGAAKLGGELIEAMPELQPAVSAPPPPQPSAAIIEPPVPPPPQPDAAIIEPPKPSPSQPEEADARPLKVPSFLMLEQDVPLFERGADLLPLPELESYTPPKPLSILDPTPLPEEPDYLRILALLLSICILVIAVRVVWYYSTRHVNLDSASNELNARYSQPLVVPPNAPDPVAGPVDDTLYYPDSGVTLPLLLSKVEPEYTAEEAAAQVQGKVIMLVPIDQAGKPVTAEARVWHGLNPELNVLALKTVGQWRFRPGMKDGKPVPVLAQVEVNFHRP